MSNQKIKKVIFLGRKKEAIDAVKFLIENRIKIAAIIGVRNDPSSIKLLKIANENEILFILNEKVIYKLIANKDKRLERVDLVISYLYSKKIKNSLIYLGRLGCINFHPAPLPDYKSSAGYNTAILDERLEYGVSAHFIDSEEFDAGPIIRVLRFPIGKNENVISLFEKSQTKLLELFKETIILFQAGEKLKTIENKGGLFLNKKQFEDLKKVDIKKDSLDLINKKIRAFFFPPHTGAKIRIGNQDFTLINNDLLKYLDELIKR